MEIETKVLVKLETRVEKINIAQVLTVYLH